MQTGGTRCSPNPFPKPNKIRIAYVMIQCRNGRATTRRLVFWQNCCINLLTNQNAVGDWTQCRPITMQWEETGSRVL